MKKLKLIYISSEYSGPVVESQVYKLLDYYVSTNWFEEVVLIQQYTSSENLTITEEVLKKHYFKHLLFQAHIYNPFVHYRSIRKIAYLLKQETTKNNYVIHTRGIMLAYQVDCALKRINKPANILADERGDIFDHLRFNKKKNIFSKVKSRIQFQYFKHCYKGTIKNNIQITVVSDKLKSNLIMRGFSSSNICVHPNIAAEIFIYDEKKRKDVRMQLHIAYNECLAVFSSGEGTLWQKDKELVNILLDQGIKILNLGKNKIDNPKVINLFVPHNEMPFYLSAADVAVLWRDHAILNEVASPSKFGEFAVMGLYLIHNQSVDLATRFILDNDCGLLVKTPNEVKIDKRASAYQTDRKRRIEAGIKKFSVQEIANSYFSKYCMINNDN